MEMTTVFDDDQLDRYQQEARNALENFLDRLTLPTLTTGPTYPLELTLTASLRTSGPLPPQTLELVVTPLKVRTETDLLTFGAALPAKAPLRGLEEFFDASDLSRLDDILKS